MVRWGSLVPRDLFWKVLLPTAVRQVRPTLPGSPCPGVPDKPCERAAAAGWVLDGGGMRVLGGICGPSIPRHRLLRLPGVKAARGL